MAPAIRIGAAHVTFAVEDSHAVAAESWARSAELVGGLRATGRIVSRV